MRDESSGSLVDDSIFIIGQPPVRDFLQFVSEWGVGGQRGTDEPFASLWRNARHHVKQLDTLEGGIADNPPLLPIPDTMRSLADRELERPEVQGMLRYVSHSWRMVELDRLVVYQKRVNLGYVRQIAAQIPASLTDEFLINMALARATAPPPVQVANSSNNDYWFSSPSCDVRFLNIVRVNPEDIRGANVLGQPAVAIAIFVGSTTNHFNVVHYQNRLVLHNGTHRMYALRQRGVTHVPCLVAEATDATALELVGHAELTRQANLLFRSPRPPMFKDYFDSRLHAIIPTTRLTRVLRLELKTHRDRIPAI